MLYYGLTRPFLVKHTSILLVVGSLDDTWIEFIMFKKNH